MRIGLVVELNGTPAGASRIDAIASMTDTVGLVHGG